MYDHKELFDYTIECLKRIEAYEILGRIKEAVKNQASDKDKLLTLINFFVDTLEPDDLDKKEIKLHSDLLKLRSSILSQVI